MEMNIVDNSHMDVKDILLAFQEGKLSIEDATTELYSRSFEDIGFAKIDHSRKKRQGFAEVVFCQGKTIEQIVAIMSRLASYSSNVLATRASQEMYNEVKMMIPEAVYHKLPRLITIKRKEVVVDSDRYILVMTAGTSDIPVAEEAAITAEIMGNKVVRSYDVGVAGIHRLLSQQNIMANANVIIVAAGMEGALASVVAGMNDKPVIAVPTSVGYGANFGGISALLTMLNSCASGIGVVNIDNGFGAGRLASMINKMR